jgi:cytochrome c biogenesis protein CcmG/thiol:disulfide interchange protein DsbE
VQSEDQLAQTPTSSFAQPEPEEDSTHGRIGYGSYGRFTPAAMAVVMVVALAAIGIYQWDRSNGDSDPPRLAGNPAPDVTLSLFNGQQLRLSDYRGSIVVLNFWASWCEPCKEEAPLLQNIDPNAVPAGASVAVIGVDLKNDKPENARAFLAENGITYQTGQDTGGEERYRGPIEIEFGIAANYPTTIFIRPDGVIDSVYIGQIDQESLNRSIAAAVD